MVILILQKKMSCVGLFTLIIDSQNGQFKIINKLKLMYNELMREYRQLKAKQIDSSQKMHAAHALMKKS
jgi:hypothetical protein